MTKRKAKKETAAAPPPIDPHVMEIVTARCRQLLFFLKRGKPVEFLRVWLTHENIHRIHASNTPLAKQARERFPLEIIHAKGMDMERKFDTSQFTTEWRIALPTP